MAGDAASADDPSPVEIIVCGGESSPVRFSYDDADQVWVDAAGTRLTPGDMLLLLHDVCFGVFEQPLDETWRRWKREQKRTQ